MKTNSSVPSVTNASDAFAFVTADAPRAEKLLITSPADKQTAPIELDDQSTPRLAETHETLADSAIATILRWKLSDKAQRGGDEKTTAGKNEITSPMNSRKRKFSIEARCDSAGTARLCHGAMSGGSGGEPVSAEERRPKS